MPKFFTRAGWLTPYALSCGYRHNQSDTILQSGGNFYEVFQFGKQNRQTFHRISDARRAFRKLYGSRRPLARHWENEAKGRVIN